MTVTETGGFSAAQVALNVGQSTISTQMADLESRLGLKLCRRGRSGFSLTDDGRVVYEAAVQFFRGADKFVEQINTIRETSSGELRIAVADALLGNPDFQFEKIVAELRTRMPRVSLVLSEADPLAIEQQVLSQRLHAGVHTFPNHAPGLRYLKLFNEKQTLYCGRLHPLFGRGDSTLSIDELGQHDYAARSYYGGRLRPGMFVPSTKNGTGTSMECIAALILSGKFIGHLPWQCARRWVEAGEMHSIMEPQLSYETAFECVIATGVRMSRSQEIFEDVVRSVLSVT